MDLIQASKKGFIVWGFINFCFFTVSKGKGSLNSFEKGILPAEKRRHASKKEEDLEDGIVPLIDSLVLDEFDDLLDDVSRAKNTGQCFLAESLSNFKTSSSKSPSIGSTNES